MNRVFVPNEPVRFVQGEPRNVFDITPASQYGEIKILTSGNSLMISPKPIIDHFMNELKDYCDDDYIIAIGDPSTMCICCCIAAMMNEGRFKLLKWNRDTNSYIVIPVNLEGD